VYQAVGRALRRHPGKSQGDAYGITGVSAEALSRALYWADGGFLTQVPDQVARGNPAGAPP
jgi:hypothetical protein